MTALGQQQSFTTLPPGRLESATSERRRVASLGQYLSVKSIVLVFSELLFYRLCFVDEYVSGVLR